MKTRIQPVIDLNTLVMSAPTSPAFVEGVRQMVQDLVTKLRQVFGESAVLDPVSRVPDRTAFPTFVLWFVFEGFDANEAERLPEAVKPFVLLLNYEHLRALPLLERTGVGGLIERESAENWIQDQGRRMFKLGQGYGFYGLKTLWPEQDAEALPEGYQSANYALLYDQQIRDLGRLLQRYFDRLAQKVPAPAQV